MEATQIKGSVLEQLDVAAMAATVQPLTIDTNVLGGIAILHTLQRAVRHPHFRALPNIQWLEIFTRDLEKAIVTKHPMLHDACAAGWEMPVR